MPNPTDVSFEQKLLTEFLEFLKKQNLRICHFSQTNQIYWPAYDSQIVKQNFFKERQNIG